MTVDSEVEIVVSGSGKVKQGGICHAVRRELGPTQTGKLRHIHVVIVEDIRPVITRRIALASADIAAVGIAEHFNKLVDIALLLCCHTLPEDIQSVLILPQQKCVLGGIIIHGAGVFQRLHRPAVDLLEVALGIGTGKEVRVDIKRHHAPRQPQGVIAGISLVGLDLDRQEMAGNLLQFRHGGPVNLLDTGIHGVNCRQHGIAGNPVEIGALAGAPGPVVYSPGPSGRSAVLCNQDVVLISLPLPGRVIHIQFAVGKINNFLPGVRLVGGYPGEFPLIQVIDRNGRAPHQHRFALGYPGESAVSEQAVPGCHGGQIMSPGIAMPLGVHDLGISLVDKSVLVPVADIIGLNVCHFPVAIGKVPDKPVVERRRLSAARAVIPASQQYQFLLQERISLILESKQG